MTNIAMERSIIFNGKIHYFDWAIFNSKLYVYQMVDYFGGANIPFHSVHFWCVPPLLSLDPGTPHVHRVLI